MSSRQLRNELTATASDRRLVPAFEEEIIRMLHRDAGRPDLTALHARAEHLPEGPERTRLLHCLSMGLTIKDRMEQHQQRERGLMAVIDTAQDLTRITDTDKVLQLIVQRARTLLGCDVGYLSVYDPQMRDFYVRATDGAFSENFGKIRVSLDTGVCGYVARHRSPYSSSDYAGDGRFNHSKFIDGAMGDENIASILGVPLLGGEEVSGVLFVGDRYVRTYTAWEISILSTLGAQASVAIGNARLFEQAQDALKQASATNELLRRQTEDTRAAAQAHEQLTTLVASGGGPADLCVMLARRLDGRVVVCDDGGREMVAADRDGQIEEPPQAEGWVDDAVYAALAESCRTGRSVACGGLRKVCAVLGGNERLGGLVLHTDQPLNDMRARIFERGAMVMGVVLLAQVQRASALMSDASAVLHGLVYGARGNFESLARQAERYGVDIRRPMRLLLIRAECDDCAYLRRRLVGRLGASCALFDDLGDALLALANEPQMEQIKTAALSCLGRHHGKFFGVLSGPIRDPDSLPKSLDVAERSLTLLEALGRHGEIFGEERLALYAALFSRADAAAIKGFLIATLGGLYTGDPVRDGRRVDLARTLLAYLDHSHSAAEAARHLTLHINTLRQRLEAIDALLPDWRGAGRALEIHMALRLWQLRDDDLLTVADLQN